MSVESSEGTCIPLYRNVSRFSVSVKERISRVSLPLKIYCFFHWTLSKIDNINE